MVKGGENAPRDPIRTRKQSATDGRRNSVSDIKDYFLAKSNETISPMPPKKASAKVKSQEKEKRKELNQVRQNIKAMIEGQLGEGDQPTVSSSEHVECENNQTELAHAHDATSEQSHEQCGLGLEVTKTSVATQTSEDEMLSAISELLDKYKRLENTVEDPKNGLTVQLAKTKETVTQLYTDINGAVSGLKVQMEKVNKITLENCAKFDKLTEGKKQVASLLDENKRLISELKIMQGLVQKLSQQTDSNSNQLLDLTRRGMEQNLLIHGVDDTIEIEDAKADPPMFTYKERCRESLQKFFREVMNVSIDTADIWKVHRSGLRKEGKVRPIVVKLAYSAKDLIMENLSALKDKTNSKTKQKYFISEQVPDGVVERKKQVSARVKTLKDINEKKPKADRSRIQVINDTIVVDEKIDIPEVSTPKPSELFLDPRTQNRIDDLQQCLMETEPEILRNSEFVGMAAKANSTQKVKDLYIAAMQRYPSADHAIMAYSLKEAGTLKSGSCDDREFGAGNKLRKMLFELKAKDTVVFVLRRYGGVHLGFNRFSIIEQVAKSAIAMLE